MTRYDTTGLRECLRDFEAKGSTYEKNGRWKIAIGGYDLNWELYYDNNVVLQCVGKKLKSVRNNLPDKIYDIIKDEYKDLKRSFRVSCTMIYNGSILVDAADENEAIKKVNDDLVSTNGDDFPDSGIFGGVKFTFGEATADEAEEED